MQKALDEVLPVAFFYRKGYRQTLLQQNEEIVVTATDFDRQLAATKRFRTHRR